MGERRYIINPLRWEKRGSGRDYILEAQTPFGSYSIMTSAYQESFRGPKCLPSWRYDSGDERNIDPEFECKSLRECKQKAWEDWVDRISGALSELCE
jgi:hypothetical protein